jgi:hypothetical protein
MILQGSIERFDLGSVLQFLALNAATGILEVRDHEDHGYIYLVKGRLEAISLPLSDDRLGIHLVKSGLLNEGNLTRVLMEEAGNGEGVDVRKPLGQRLVEKGFTSETVVRQAMCRLTMARMFELAHWHTGVFTYDEPQHMPRFDISIRGDVQELLLQTQVRIDHGEKPRKRAGVLPEGPCYRCPVTDCSPVVRQKYLKKDLCLWRQMSSVPDVRTGPGNGVNPLYAEEDPNDAATFDRAWVQF